MSAEIEDLSTEQQRGHVERLRNQCAKAMNEVESLRTIHAEMSCRCEKAEREAESYRQEYASKWTKLFFVSIHCIMVCF